MYATLLKQSRCWVGLSTLPVGSSVVAVATSIGNTGRSIVHYANRNALCKKAPDK